MTIKPNGSLLALNDDAADDDDGEINRTKYGPFE